MVNHIPAVTDTVDAAARTSFAARLDEYSPRAWSLARRILGDDELAEDVVQEAFLAYWRNPAAYDGTRGGFGSWFLSLVHHKAVDAVRREESQRRRVDASARLAGPETVRDVAETVADRLADGRVRSALEGLPAVQREALVLAYWGGLTQREIAQRTGAPLGTVKTRMFSGMRRLHEGLRTSVAPAVVAPRLSGG